MDILEIREIHCIRSVVPLCGAVTVRKWHGSLDGAVMCRSVWQQVHAWCLVFPLPLTHICALTYISHFLTNQEFAINGLGSQPHETFQPHDFDDWILEASWVIPPLKQSRNCYQNFRSHHPDVQHHPRHPRVNVAHCMTPRHRPVLTLAPS